MSTLCASCEQFSIDTPVLSSSQKTPQWLEKNNHVVKFIQNTGFEVCQPSHSDQVITLSMDTSAANRKVLYWAADRSSSLIIHDAERAYNKFENYGIAQLDSDGNTEIYLRSPQIYSTIAKGKNTRESFYRHLHAVVSNKALDEWLPDIYTQVVICVRDLDYVLSKVDDGCAIILNALPCSSYAHDHIPNSFNLTGKQVEEWSSTELSQWLLSLCKLHYPTITGLLESKQLLINEVPVICYCANPACSASENLQRQLLKKGMLQIDSFPGGMEDYRKHFSNEATVFSKNLIL